MISKFTEMLIWYMQSVQKFIENEQNVYNYNPTNSLILWSTGRIAGKLLISSTSFFQWNNNIYLIFYIDYNCDIVKFRLFLPGWDSESGILNIPYLWIP